MLLQFSDIPGPDLEEKESTNSEILTELAEFVGNTSCIPAKFAGFELCFQTINPQNLSLILG